MSAMAAAAGFLPTSLMAAIEKAADDMVFPGPLA